MTTDKYLRIFLHKMEVTVYVINNNIIITIILFTEVEVNSGGYLLSRAAAR